MSPEMQSTLELLQTNAYVSLAIVTAVLYDYALTISSEVQYVWHQTWTWVSTLFVLIRYFGLLSTIILGLWSSIFMPASVKICTATYLIALGAFLIFISAADLVMILRIYAMWNQSNLILWFLLFIYVPQVTFSLAVLGIYYNPNTYLPVTILQVLDLSVCHASPSDATSMFMFYVSILRLTLGVTLLILALITTLKQPIEMYRATKEWQPNKYMQQLMHDGILYFLVYTLYYITMALSLVTRNTTWQLFLNLVCYTAICPIMPRFIISIRELYDRDLHARWQGIDSRFGVLSQPIASETVAVSAIAIAEVATEQGQGGEGDTEAIGLGVGRWYA